MPQFSTLEATSTGEKVVNLGKMWSTATLGRRTSWLISPASVEAIALQLQSDLLVVFGAVAFATLLVSELTFAKNLSCLELTFAKTLSPFTMILPRPLSALLEMFQNAGQLWFFERQVLGNVRHVNPFTVVVFKLVVLIFESIVFSVMVIIHVVVLSHIGVVSPINVEGRVR